MSRMSTKQMMKNVARKTGREAAANDDHGEPENVLFVNPALPKLTDDELVAYGRECGRIETNINALTAKLNMYSRATKDVVSSLRKQQQLYLKSINDGTKDEHALSQVRDILDRQNGKERPKGLKVEEEIGGNFVVRFETENDVGF